ncbi:MAG: hypothetical protein ACI8RZ_007914, partial [Myxococcota bacterium]
QMFLGSNKHPKICIKLIINRQKRLAYLKYVGSTTDVRPNSKRAPPLHEQHPLLTSEEFPMFAFLLTASMFTNTADAMSCWEITSWTPNTGSGTEFANLIPTD